MQTPSLLLSALAMLLWEAALLQTRAMLCGTSSLSNNPSAQNVNRFLFANLWPPEPFLLALLTLPIVLLLDGFLGKNGMIFLPGPWLIQMNSYSNALFQKPPSQKKSQSMTIALKHMPVRTPLNTTAHVHRITAPLLAQWESASSAADTGDVGSILGSGRPPGGGNGNPLQHSCLKNPTDREAWWAIAIGLQRVGHNRGEWVHTHTPKQSRTAPSIQ